MTEKKLPRFKSREEFANFFDHHDSTNYLEQTKEVDKLFVLAPELMRRIRDRSKKKLVALRLTEWQIDRARAMAKKLHTPYQSIIRRWVEQGILAEAHSK